MSRPLVSIITPVFNGGPFISAAIRSVLQQTYDHWELIIINDGSTDNSEQCIKSFGDSRIKYDYQANHGVSAARNAGLDIMEGEFFCFLDADDYLPPGSLKSRLNIFEKDPAIRFVDGMIGIYARDLSKLSSTWKPAFRGNPLQELLTLSGSCFFGPSWMIRRDKSIRHHFDENLSHGEDLLFYLESSRGGGLYDFTDDVILHYRKGHHSAMKNLKGLENGYCYIYRHLQEMNIREADRIKFKKKAKNIMFRSYLGQLRPRHAIQSQIRKW